jgi:hypothetical protein
MRFEYRSGGWRVQPRLCHCVALDSGGCDRESSQGLNALPGIKRALKAMQYEFREGDWVCQHSFWEPIRVIGLGSTIAVQFPNGEMRAFEPDELEKVSIVAVSRPKVLAREHRPDRRASSVGGFASLATSFGLICLILLVLAALAGVGR